MTGPLAVTESTGAKRCPECVGGVVRETLRYSQPPLGVARWQSPDWLRVPGRESRTYEVEASRPCIRCGGRGEL